MNAMMVTYRLHVRCYISVACLLAGTIANVACNPKTDEARFICSKSAGAGCPAGEMCPEIPLGSGGCEDLPGLFGHPKVIVQTGRPVGCVLLLPYENPYYPGSPQDCFCEQSTFTDNLPRWTCGL